MTWYHLLTAYLIGLSTGLSLGYLLRSAQKDCASQYENKNKVKKRSA